MSSSHSRPRIGIVGAGIRGSLFGRSLAQHPGVDVVAVTDTFPGAADRAAQTLGIQGYTCLEDMIADADLTAVVIATPDFAHRDPSVVAATAGLDILIEKPLATTVAEAEEIAAAVTRGGGKIMIGFENRWNPRFVAARANWDRLGDVRHQVVHLNDTRFVPTKMLAWAAASSPAWFLMPHSLDLALWLSGKTVASVFATGARGVLDAEGVQTWDSVDAVIEYTDGTVTVLHSAWILPESFPAVYDLRYEAVGTDGAVRVIGADHGVHTYTDRSEWTQWGTYELGDKLHGFPVNMAYTFADLIRGGDVDVPGIEDGLIVTRVIEAIHRSLESKSMVSLL